MLNHTIIKLSLCLIAGILLGDHFLFSPAALLPAGIFILLLFLAGYFRAQKLFVPDALFGISTLLLFIFLGISTATLNRPAVDPAHYVHHITGETTEVMVARVEEKLKPGTYHDKYIISAKALNGRQVTGRILLNVATTGDSLQPLLNIGDKITAIGEVQPINTPRNPYQFNYSDHMESLGVLRQVTVNREQVLRQEDSGTPGIKEIAGQIRGSIISKLREFDFKRDELAIIQALLLGQRQEISQEIYSNYVAAGVIHILAVSGLHVGIILLLFNKLLSPVERLRGGKVLKTILLLILMWSFAVLAGLSPSVIRAVSMFSFVAVGMQLNRRTSVLNSLFISLLVLLLINPAFLSQVGFQLSYAAVFTIVLVQPHLFSLYRGNSRAIKYLWGILTVTIAAQMGVLPLSLYYFHQFPGLFFLTNLLILPFLGLILGLGILVMLLALLDLLPEILATAFGSIINFLNEVVGFMGSKEDFIIENISFSLLLCIASYLLVAGIIFMLKSFGYRSIVFFLISVVLLQAAFISEKVAAGPSEAVIFHKSRNTVIGVKDGQQLVLYHDLQEPALSYSFIKDYYTEKNIKELTQVTVRDLYRLNEKLVLRIDSSAVFKFRDISPQVILLTNSPRLNLDRLIEELQPELIIADGSNYPTVIERWRKTAAKKKLPFHATGEKGAYIMSTGIKP